MEELSPLLSFEEIIKNLISRVNSTLCQYEADWIGCKRTPESEESEMCSSFEQYVEIRFNYECYEIPELRKLISDTDGHLFICTGLDDPDTAKRRFTTAHIELINPNEFENPDEEFINDIEQVKKFLGGTKISFNNVKKKIKFIIE